MFLKDPHLPPPPRSLAGVGDWSPYSSRLEFECADFLFKRTQMSQSYVDELLELWAASLVPLGGTPPFADFKDLFAVIDSTSLGDAPWMSMKARYKGDFPPDAPSWMTTEYEISYRDTLVCARHMVGNPDFAKEFDVAPYREYNASLTRRYTNLMSGDWAWEQAVRNFSPIFYQLPVLTLCSSY